MAIGIAVLSALVLLTGLAVYSALRLAKRTDDIITCMDGEEEHGPLVVRFPESVFSRSEQPGVTARKS